MGDIPCPGLGMEECSCPGYGKTTQPLLSGRCAGPGLLKPESVLLVLFSAVTAVVSARHPRLVLADTPCCSCRVRHRGLRAVPPIAVIENGQRASLLPRAVAKAIAPEAMLQPMSQF